MVLLLHKLVLSLISVCFYDLIFVKIDNIRAIDLEKESGCNKENYRGLR